MNRTNKTAADNQQGFTLIELMVVVAILAVITAIAIPSYRQHVLKSNRAVAVAFMLQAANREEQIMLDMRSYVAVAADAAFGTAPPTGINMPVPANADRYYNFTITTPAPGSYLITATPVGTQLTADTQCGTLTLDQTGNKTVTGTNPVASCW